MAKVLDQFPEDAKHSRQEYDWAELLDGQIRELVPGVDFYIKPQSFRSAATQRAYERNGTVVFAKRDNGNLVMQFVPNKRKPRVVGDMSQTG